MVDRNFRYGFPPANNICLTAPEGNRQPDFPRSELPARTEPSLHLRLWRPSSSTLRAVGSEGNILPEPGPSYVAGIPLARIPAKPAGRSDCSAITRGGGIRSRRWAGSCARRRESISACGPPPPVARVSRMPVESPDSVAPVSGVRLVGRFLLLFLAEQVQELLHWICLLLLLLLSLACAFLAQKASQKSGHSSQWVVAVRDQPF